MSSLSVNSVLQSFFYFFNRWDNAFYLFRIEFFKFVF